MIISRSLSVLAPLIASLTLLSCSAPPANESIKASVNSHSAQSTALAKSKQATDPISFNDFSSELKAQQLSLAQGFVYEGPFTPYQGSLSRIYGSTGAGCLEGSQQLKEGAQGIQIQRWALNRDYGHPLMIQYLSDLSERTRSLGLPPLLIGDISQSLGGPYGPKSNHASHNTGIDVDLPFDFALPRKSVSELANPQDVYIVRGSKIQKTFTKSIELYIKTAASDPRVDRIFVAPMIKKHMCRLYEGQEHNGFLHKLRPWFGHQAHMHVRLKCPFDSPECISQMPVPQGTGCGYELESWFLPPPPKSTIAKPKVKKERILPAKCTQLLKLQ